MKTLTADIAAKDGMCHSSPREPLGCVTSTLSSDATLTKSRVKCIHLHESRVDALRHAKQRCHVD